MKTINLEQIAKDNLFSPELNNGQFIRVKAAMKEAVKQALELAVENVNKVEFVETGPMDESVIESITNTINQIVCIRGSEEHADTALTIEEAEARFNVKIKRQ